MMKILFLFSTQYLHGLHVAVKALAHDRRNTGSPDKGHLSKVLTLTHIGNVYLHRRYSYRLQGVQQ